LIVLGLLSLVVAGLMSLVLVVWARDHARRYQAHLPQRFHVGDVPRIGGLAMAVGSAAGWSLGTVYSLAWDDPANLDFGWLAITWLATLLPALVGGLWEDLTQRAAVRWRLLLTGASGVLAVLVLGLGVQRLEVPLLDAALAQWPVLGIVLAVVAVTGLPHAFNIIDGYNGLAAVVAVVIMLALAHVALQVGDRQLAALLVCAAAATGGFLFWNYPNGLLFAGDGGAYFWGGVISLASLTLVLRHAEVSPWFPMLLLMYPVWETLFSIYRKLARGISPGVADALHFHQLVYRRIVRGVIHDDAARRMLIRNNRTSPYLWGFALLTVTPAIVFWRSTPVLMAFCALFAVSYVAAYLMIIRFKVPTWLRR
jgi:UDP-GlcNAc:undecaprenyl-phosphate/decaprenyl-phosphate GlcNAc-1-phosphate transferase